jgi:hypothetical protein
MSPHRLSAAVETAIELMSNKDAVRHRQSRRLHTMGMDRTVIFTGGAAPAWQAVQQVLSQAGYPVQLRMIEGQLAFPDEQPAQSWNELRVGTPQGMVTIRREADRVRLVVWGNADAGLLQAWNALTWAFAEAGGGLVEGSQSAGDFRRQTELPSALRGN